MKNKETSFVIYDNVLPGYIGQPKRSSITRAKLPYRALKFTNKDFAEEYAKDNSQSYIIKRLEMEWSCEDE